MVPVIDAIAHARRCAIRKPLCGQRALERAAEKLLFNIGRLDERQSRSLAWPPAQPPFLALANGKSCRRAEKEAVPQRHGIPAEKLSH
jgi:hypothetical protein